MMQTCFVFSTYPPFKLKPFDTTDLRNQTYVHDLEKIPHDARGKLPTQRGNLTNFTNFPFRWVENGVLYTHTCFMSKFCSSQFQFYYELNLTHILKIRTQHH